MTVPSIYGPVTYLGDGMTVNFPFPFQFLAKLDVGVALIQANGDPVDPPPLLDGKGPNDYKLNGTIDKVTGEWLDGTVTFNTPPSGSRTVKLSRHTPPLQPVDLQDDAPFPADTMEVALDRAMLAIQDHSLTPGPIGPQGEQGIQGEPGPQGNEGPQGPAGAQGAQGIQGAPGPTGATGAVGPAGAQGNPGPQGAKGDQGAQGVAGAVGPQGATGAQGPQGYPGPTGADGATGPQGAKGAQGDPGPQGSQGIQGPPGATGPQGPKGDQGIQGIQGPPGDVSTALLKANNLSDLGNVTTARNNLGISATGADPNYLTKAANLSDVADKPTARNNLGLGTAAVQNIGTSGANVPLLNGNNTWSQVQSFQIGVDLGNGGNFWINGTSTYSQINFDANDYILYDRTNNILKTFVAGVQKLQTDGNRTTVFANNNQVDALFINNAGYSIGLGNNGSQATIQAVDGPWQNWRPLFLNGQYTMLGSGGSEVLRAEYSKVTIQNPSNTRGALFIQGTARALRLGSDTWGSYVDGLDNTGTQWQPIQIVGSTAYLSSSNGASSVYVDGGGCTVQGPWVGLRNSTNNNSAVTCGSDATYINAPSPANVGICFQIDNSERGRINGGGFFKLSNYGAHYSNTDSYHEFGTNQGYQYCMRIWNAAPKDAQPHVQQFLFTGGAPNDAVSQFIWCGDTASGRASLLSNGGLANFQGNNQNWSDRSLKSDITFYDDAELDALEASFLQVKWGKYRFNDQTHADWNHGYIAQDVEAAFKDTAPELVDESNIAPAPPPTPEGTPHDEPEPIMKKVVYDTDLTHIALALLSRALTRIADLESRVAALEQPAPTPYPTGVT